MNPHRGNEMGQEEVEVGGGGGGGGGGGATGKWPLGTQ